MDYVALIIFLVSFVFIVFDWFDKSLVALAGAFLMIFLGILTPEDAVSAIQYEAIFILIAMMILVHFASKSGIFQWINTKIAGFTKGNPLAIFLFFSLLTGFVSSFLPNVTTIVLIVPLVIELLKGMGKDPKPYLFSVIMFSNIGGDLTLIGDASNIIIGASSGLSFFEFIQNLWIPVLSVSIFTILCFVIVKWKDLKPISGNLLNLFIASVVISTIKDKFSRVKPDKSFILSVLIILIFAIFGFLFEKQIGLPNYIVAFAAAILLAIICAKKVPIHESLNAVEWTTLLFFCGLFIMVGGLQKTGLLEQIGELIANSTTNIFYLSLIILWACGIFSMIIDNIPFVTVMIPVILSIQRILGVDTDATVLWWALSMGACIGGNGTLIGGSANVVTVGIAKKCGIHISFLEYLRFGLPLTLGALTVCSAYLFFRLT